MPRHRRADVGDEVYHAFNRGNARQTIFRKPADYQAIVRALVEALDLYAVDLYCFVRMPNHWHLVLRPARDGEMGRLLRWVTATHTQRYHAHDHTSGDGHVDQARFKSFPVASDEHDLVVCGYVERNPLRAGRFDRAKQWRHGSLRRWTQTTEPPPSLLSECPIARSPKWIEWVHRPVTQQDLAAVRTCVQGGRPYGEEAWVRQVAERSGLQYTLHPRGRPPIHLPRSQS